MIYGLILLAVISTIFVVPVAAEHYDTIGRELYFGNPQSHENCYDTLCHEIIISDYTKLYGMYHTMYHNHTENIRTIEHLQDEVNVWHNKYNYLLAQQGNQTIQDKVANLTDRMDAVETKAATNESLIYIIQNMLRTCLLYTSPSPRDRQKSRMPSSA